MGAVPAVHWISAWRRDTELLGRQPPQLESRPSSSVPVTIRVMLPSRDGKTHLIASVISPLVPPPLTASGTVVSCCTLDRPQKCKTRSSEPAFDTTAGVGKRGWGTDRHHR